MDILIMIDMTKLQTIKVRFENIHSDGSVFLSINGGECYLLLERSVSGKECFIYVDENGRAYNEHNKPCTIKPTTNILRILQVEEKLKELQNEINCIRRGD